MHSKATRPACTKGQRLQSSLRLVDAGAFQQDDRLGPVGAKVEFAHDPVLVELPGAQRFGAQQLGRVGVVGAPGTSRSSARIRIGFPSWCMIREKRPDRCKRSVQSVVEFCCRCRLPVLSACSSGLRLLYRVQAQPSLPRRRPISAVARVIPARASWPSRFGIQRNGECTMNHDSWQARVQPVLGATMRDKEVPGIVLAVARGIRPPEFLAVGTGAENVPLTADTSSRLRPLPNWLLPWPCCGWLPPARCARRSAGRCSPTRVPPAMDHRAHVTVTHERAARRSRTGGGALHPVAHLADAGCGLPGCAGVAPPRSRVTYSNVGIGLLAVIVERRTGMPLRRRAGGWY